MIEFASEHIRTMFHCLPADLQKEYNDLALKMLSAGEVMKIYNIEKWGPDDSNLEIDVRFHKKFDVAASVRKSDPS